MSADKRRTDVKAPDKVSRRKLLQGLGGAGGAALVGGVLPQQWTRPVVDTVVLPVHAQTSGAVVEGGGGGGGGLGSLEPGLLDYVMPTAEAGGDKTKDFKGCVSFRYSYDPGTVEIIGDVELVQLAPICWKPYGVTYDSAGGLTMSKVNSHTWEVTTGTDVANRSFDITLNVTRVNPQPGQQFGKVTISEYGGHLHYYTFGVFEGTPCIPEQAGCKKKED